MGSIVRREELGDTAIDEGSEYDESEPAGPDATNGRESESLGTFLSGRLTGTDVEPVDEIRRLRRRERE